MKLNPDNYQQLVNWISLDTAAHIIGVSRASVVNFVVSGRITEVRSVKGLSRIVLNRSEVELFTENYHKGEWTSTRYRDGRGEFEDTEGD